MEEVEEEREVEVPFGAIPDDHISMWFAPLPVAVRALVQEILPSTDFDRVDLVIVTPTTLCLPVLQLFNYEFLRLGDRPIGGPDPFAVCTYAKKRA